jgi:hypothetical protein
MGTNENRCPCDRTTQGQAVVFVGFSGVNATNCRSHAAGAARQKNVRAGYLLSRR